MDAWGIDGCREQWDALRAGLSEVALRLLELPQPPAWLDPEDPAGSLLQEALIRAQIAASAGSDFEFVTTERLVADTYRLAAKLPPDLAGIVGIARSGILPANLLCQHLHLPMWILRQDDNPAQPREWGHGDVISAGNGWRLHDRPAVTGRPTMLVVDDTQMTGRSVRRARPIAQAWAREHGYELMWAVIYQNPLVNPKDRAELFARALPQPHFLEWNLFNSHLAARAAFDIDGVLCDERPKQFGPHGRPPLYPSRKVPLKLLVTGRHERHRESTLAWLAKWGMRCERLEMLPDGVEHGPGVISRHKAEHFAASGLSWFIESCPIQAREIAELTGKPVICPAAGKVF